MVNFLCLFGDKRDTWRMSSDGYVNLGLSLPPTILTMIGNPAFFITLLKTSSLHTPSNVLLGALCVTDLLAGAICQPINMVLRIQKQERCCSPLLRTYWFMVHMSPLNSFVFSLLITLDRYIAICHPYRYIQHASCRRYVYVTFGLFGISMIYATVELRVYDYSPVTFWALELVLELLFIVAVFITYLRIYGVVRSQRRRITGSSNVFVGRQSRISIRERSKTYTVGIILAIFIACYAPYIVYSIMSILYLLGDIEDYKYIFQLEISAYYLVLLNSCLNPVIYCAMSREIRRAAVKIFMPNSRFARNSVNALGNMEINRGRRIDQSCAESEL